MLFRSVFQSNEGGFCFGRRYSYYLIVMWAYKKQPSKIIQQKILLDFVIYIYICLEIDFYVAASLVIFFNVLCCYVNSKAVIFTKHTYPVNIESHLHPYQTRIDITGLSGCAAYCADEYTPVGGNHVCMGFKHER